MPQHPSIDGDSASPAETAFVGPDGSHQLGGQAQALGAVPNKSKKAVGLVAVGILIVLAVGGFIAFRASQSESTHPIQEAAERCHVEGNVGDEGASIEFDTEGEEDSSGDDFTDVACVLADLDAPDRVISKMDSTRALDGTLDAHWDNYEASWNYHPDSGMNLTVYEAE